VAAVKPLLALAGHRQAPRQAVVILIGVGLGYRRGLCSGV
jgi:hypothetical protein